MKNFKHLIFFAPVWKSCILVLLITCHNIIHVELFFMLPQHNSSVTRFRLGNSYAKFCEMNIFTEYSYVLYIMLGDTHNIDVHRNEALINIQYT